MQALTSVSPVGAPVTAPEFIFGFPAGVDQRFLPDEYCRSNVDRRSKKKKDEKGNEFEYFLPPATMFNVTYMVTPYFKTYSDTLKILGCIARLIKDKNLIPVDAYDWVDNNKNPIIIYPVSGMSLDKQMQIFNLLKTDYRPSLFYQLSIGIDSVNKRGFKRVKERRITAIHKKEDNEENKESQETEESSKTIVK